MDELKNTANDKATNALRLSRETLRELDDMELEQVAGGKHRETHSCENGCGGASRRCV